MRLFAAIRNPSGLEAAPGRKPQSRNMSHRLTQIDTDEDGALPHLCSSVSICGKSAIRPSSQGLPPSQGLRRTGRRAGNPQCRRTHDTLPKLMYLMIQTLKSGFIERVFGLFVENLCNCHTMNILHKTGSLSNGAYSRSIKVNQG
jgi:hypothetical protein